MIKSNLTELIPATLDQRRAAYDWCFHSDTSKHHSGEHLGNPIPTFEEFCEDYEDYYFTGSQPASGRGYIITCDGLQIGFINYACFHLRTGMAELDIWLNAEEHLGKGYGVDAINALCGHLHTELGITTFILRPSGRNPAALKGYAKAGFEVTDVEPSHYLLDDFIEIYGDGDYGADDTVTMMRRV